MFWKALSAFGFQWKSLFFTHLLRVLKKGSDFFADLDKNLFKLVSFLSRIDASFNVWGDCSFITAFAFPRQALVPCMMSKWPRNAPSSASNVIYIHLQVLADLFFKCIVYEPLENMSKLSLSKLQSSILPFSDRLTPIVTVCSGYSGWIATLIPSTAVGSWGRSAWCSCHHYALRCPGWPIIPLNGDGDLTTMKFIRVLVERFPSPKDIISDICPNDQDILPLNPRREVLAGTILFLTFGCNLLKQCSYSTSKADPPSTYMRWIRCPSTSALITIGFSCTPSPLRGGKEISRPAEKLWVTFCLVIHCQGWIMKIVVAFSLLGASPFLAAFACSPRLPHCFISLTKCDSCHDLTASFIFLLRWIHSCETVLLPTRLVLALEIESLVEVGPVAGFMVSPCDEVFGIWKTFGGNRRHLGSFGEEMDKTTNLHQHLSRISIQRLETASQITRDAVTTHTTTASQDFKTTSDCMTQPII
uniref:Uncharacterized protein n=1 Tax=Tanacetum cinerariifolium TaxID=118510 RepID=A0A6L2N4Y9_TANCI|nr:hypothetical protein [Tanacetum cinerariifolium]